jgi:hypothetical protein
MRYEIIAVVTGTNGYQLQNIWMASLQKTVIPGTPRFLHKAMMQFIL